MSGYEFHETGHAPIKSWTKGVPVDDGAMEQLRNTASLPFVYKHVAAMPDVHWGMGATVGSVVATKGAIVPAAVGVDIGCGMMAVETTLTADDLPDSLAGLREAIERAVPVGGPGNNGTWYEQGRYGPPNGVAAAWDHLHETYNRIVEKHPKASNKLTSSQLGTLGTGNHFIEICLDENGSVWAMLHSGSRGPGNAIGRYFIERAKREMERWHIGHYLPDRNLSYLVEHTELFDDYWAAVSWAQEFALVNRELMMRRVLSALRDTVSPFQLGRAAVNCHHNYVDRENHFGENVLVTRKGAVRARAGDLGIIPGSMGARSYIVRGKGNADSFHSCSHGAGRVMSRTEAKKAFTVEDHVAATEGVECRKDEGVIDETPGAYKSIDAVMAAQTDLVEVVRTLKQVVCVKG